MIAEIFHWWLAVGLSLLGVGLVFGIIGGYLKKVVAPQYPSRRQRREDD